MTDKGRKGGALEEVTAKEHQGPAESTGSGLRNGQGSRGWGKENRKVRGVQMKIQMLCVDTPPFPGRKGRLCVPPWRLPHGWVDTRREVYRVSRKGCLIGVPHQLRAIGYPRERGLVIHQILIEPLVLAGHRWSDTGPRGS